MITSKPLSTQRRITLKALFLLAPSATMAKDRMLERVEVYQAEKDARAALKMIDTVPMTIEILNSLYSTGGAALKSRYSVDQISRRLNSVRGPLGTVESRKFFGFSGAFKSMPNLIPGEYVIINFATRFSGLDTLFDEEVTLEKDKSRQNAWHFVEYYIAPKNISNN